MAEAENISSYLVHNVVILMVDGATQLGERRVS